MAREYISKVIVNLDQLRKIQRGQRTIYDSGIVNPNSNTLIAGLSGVVSILALAFIRSTPVGVAAGVISLASGMTSSEKDILKNLVYSGYWHLGYMDDFMVDHPNYDLIEMELPFLEYTVDKEPIRFIQGKGMITRVHTKNGWIDA